MLDGILDVVELKVIRWADPFGAVMQVQDLTEVENADLYAKAISARETLIEQLADADESVMRAILEVETPPSKHPRAESDMWG